MTISHDARFRLTELTTSHFGLGVRCRRRPLVLTVIAVLCGVLASGGHAGAFEQTTPNERHSGGVVSSDVTIELQQPADPGESARFSVRLPASEIEAYRGDDAAGHDWKKIFLVTVIRDHRETAPLPMLGSYYLEKDRLVFVPRFPLRAGMTYRATYCPPQRSDAASIEIVTREFSLPKSAPLAPTTVEQVYPTRDVLPENQLKFYIHFSAPMSRGEAYRRIRLVTESGKQIEDPFLELGEELWNPDGTRFTLFFDPGRIKRGLKPREEIGPALEEGRRYALEVDGDWRDARGQSLESAYRKEFRVVAPDDTSPQPDEWQLAPPHASSRDALVLTFNEPLDHAMLQRVFSIVDADGDVVPGDVEVDEQETIWRFLPQSPWSSGSHSLVVDTTLEDLAGNSLARPFEIDVFRPLPKTEAEAKTAIPFQIEPVTTTTR